MSGQKNFQVSVGVIPAPTQNLIRLRCSVLSSDLTFFRDFFLQVLHFKMASKFQIKTWNAMCLSIVLASHEISKNYNTFWLNYGRKTNQQAKSYVNILWRGHDPTFL